MIVGIATGCALVALTTFVHAAAMVAGIRGFGVGRATRWDRKPWWGRASVVAGMAITMFLAGLVEAGLWAVSYLAIGAISGVERALYFSAVTYTTVGFGDVVLDERWRLLSAFEAANGIIMFGWTTALIAVVVQRVYIAQLTEPASPADIG